jgi:alpha-N-arabinofuranosidase
MVFFIYTGRIFMSLYMIPSLIFVISGVIDHEEDKLFSFERGDQVEINIHANKKAKEPVSRYLYGKFTEHLGRNIYNGMWAQVLQNPGFEGWHFWGSDYEDVSRRMSHFAERLGMTDIMESYNQGIAPWWLAYGRGDVTYELDKDSFNSELAQKIVVKSLEIQQIGIRQVIFLPIHREDDYDFSLYARSDKPCRLHICICKVADEGHILAKGEIEVKTREWQRYTLKLKISEVVESTPLVFIIGLSGPGTVWLDQMALFPEDNMKGFDPDVVRFTKESRLPILRYPGGNFVSGYHWKDGVGPMDKRKSTANKPWNMIEYNHVGTDEFIDFCRLTDAEPMICVNAGDGSPEEAAEWLEYCNGSKDTKYGAIRAENGHPEPYNVVYWEIGNELYGNWQIGHCTPDEYAERYEKFYKAMIAVDPEIKIIANGQDMRWNAPVIQKKGEILRSLSIHTLIGGGTPENANPDEVFESLMAYTTFYERHLKELGLQMAEKVKEPKFAVTELQVFTNRPGLPNNASLTESLFWSGIVNTCIRLGNLVEMVTHSALVNHGGGLRKEREIVYANPVYYARKLYSTQSGTIPVQIQVQCPMYKSSGRYSPVDSNVPYIDAVALIDDNDKELNLILTNRHPHETMDANIYLHNFVPAEDVRIQTLTGASYMWRNELDHPDEISLKDSAIKIDGVSLKYPVPAHSIVLMSFRK